MQIRIEITEPQDVVNAFLFLAEYIYGNGTNPHDLLRRARPDFGGDDDEPGLEFVPLDQLELDLDDRYTPTANVHAEGADA